MEKKKLYMIGNSHIDPVWFWNWDEGMQEVKATFASVLDRMNEYEEFKFTSTSTAFFQWIEKIAPSMLEEIKLRVAQGRWELTGGWFIEPDCNLPSGEAFIRQGLYGQRYLLDTFGKISEIGSNVDGFGHGSNLPQILKKSGLNNYVFMRPRVDNPVFVWESLDGSKVNTISLPGEYTTWFYESSKKNIDDTLASMKNIDHMACCYGVGNHGGGPTKKNIESIIKLREEYPNAELSFSTFEDFFNAIKSTPLENKIGTFEKFNPGCYSMDAKIKKANRYSEIRLQQADMLLSLEAAFTGTWLEEAGKMEELWKLLLFNQFHDTLGGTAIKEARDEAIMGFSTVRGSCGAIKAIAIQAIVNQVDTSGNGFPLFLFNSDGQDFHGYVEIELNWFCKDPLKLLNPQGEEIPYQRLHTKAKVRNYNLGGRRNIVFGGDIPSCGYSIYRLVIEESNLCYNNQMELDNDDPYCLENEYIKGSFDIETGFLSSIIDKQTNYESLRGMVAYQVWKDERDAWGHIQGRTYEDTGERFRLQSIEKVESGRIRECIRAIYKHEGCKLEQRYYLYAGEKEIVIENMLYWDKDWYSLKMEIPLGIDNPVTRAEGSYEVIERHIHDEDEYYMHRFLDVTKEGNEGFAISNDSKYSFCISKGSLNIILARSAIYAQGEAVNWYNPLESYEYTDIGKSTFTFVIRPHGEPLATSELYKMGRRINGAYDFLFDSCHKGKTKLTSFSMASTNKDDVLIMSIKKAEDDEDYIVRVIEQGGKDQAYCMTFLGREYRLLIGHNEIQTLKINPGDRTIKEVDLLEFNK